MYDKADILARLAAGEEAQAIANEIADVLNAAVADYEKQKEAEKAQAANQKRKEDIAKQIFDIIVDFTREFYPDFHDPEIAKLTGAEIVQNLDAAAEEARKFRHHLENFDQLLKDMEKIQKQTETNTKDPIADFLANYVDC